MDNLGKSKYTEHNTKLMHQSYGEIRTNTLEVWKLVMCNLLLDLQGKMIVGTQCGRLLEVEEKSGAVQV